jgi:protein gp37
MFRKKSRFGQNPNVVVRSSDATFLAPHKWKNKRVFVCSWSDFFVEEADAWREDAWKVMRGANSNTYMLLTKRPERIKQCLPWIDWEDRWLNVWIGVSVENQKQADIRIPLLATIPVNVRFLSIEPQLERINLTKHFTYYDGWHLPFEWIIVGGESGPDCRLFDVDWARHLLEQTNLTATRYIKFFMKQLGGWPDKRDKMSDFPQDLRVREFPDGRL